MKEKCTILIPSCDAYSDLWKPFLNLLFLYWPDCPFQICLGANSETFHHPKISMLHASGGLNWTNRVREQLRLIQTPYVLLLLEDFFMRSTIDTAPILASLGALAELDGTMLRLVPRPGPDTTDARYKFLGHCAPWARFRVSTQAAIWNRERLISLMRDDETIWEFEVRGTERTAEIQDGFFSTWRPLLTYRHHVVERGKWFRKEAHYFGSMNIGCDFNRRKLMTVRETLRWRLAKARSLLANPVRDSFLRLAFIARNKHKDLGRDECCS